MIACNNVKLLVEVKPMKKKFGDQNWAKQAKIRSKISFLLFSQVWFISFPQYLKRLELETMPNI